MKLNNTITLRLLLGIFLALSFSHSTYGIKLVGLHTWTPDPTKAPKLGDTTPNVIATGISVSMGVNVESAYTNVGGGHQINTATNSNISYTWPENDEAMVGTVDAPTPLSNSVIAIRPSTNGSRSVDIRITNTSTKELALETMQFHYRKNETASPATTALTVVHLIGADDLSPLSDLSIPSATVIDTFVPSSSWTWKNAVIDLKDSSKLSDNVLAAGESAAFRMEVPALGFNNNWYIDNLLISGSFDTDGDGLFDSAETNTGTYVDANNTGTNPNLIDSDGDGLKDGTEIQLKNLDPNTASTALIALLTNDGFMTSQDMVDIRVGSKIASVAANKATLQVVIEESDDLTAWTEKQTTPVEVPITPGSSKKFFRYKMQD